jgi:hypothetical protein
MARTEMVGASSVAPLCAVLLSTVGLAQEGSTERPV